MISCNNIFDPNIISKEYPIKLNNYRNTGGGVLSKSALREGGGMDISGVYECINCEKQRKNFFYKPTVSVKIVGTLNYLVGVQDLES